MDITPSYLTYVEDLKDEISKTRIKAALSVNKELVLLYWRIGKKILEMQEREGWGARVIENISKDLQEGFPGMRGLSARNLVYMQTFARAYAQDPITQQAAAQIPWTHNCMILDKITYPSERLWYIRKTIENGWSRNVLLMQIKSNLYGRQGKALTNFKATLPKVQSDLAHQLMKSEYNFEFLGVSEGSGEAAIEKSLMDNIRDFLLELGQGFSFVGNQHKVTLAGEVFYIDLLMYHIKLKSYVVVELKAGKFKPEYLGKLGFYAAAIDREVKEEGDQETIGLLLCQSSNKLMVEYCLQDSKKPMGVADYKTLPAQYAEHLPSPEQFQSIAVRCKHDPPS